LRIFEKKNVCLNDLNIVNTNGVSCIYIIGETCDSIFIENCTLEGTENGVRILNGKNVILRYNTFINCSNAIYCCAESSIIYYNIFQDNKVGINAMDRTGTLGIYNNVFFNNVVGISNTYSEMILYNNIFYLANSTDKAINNNQLNNLISDNNIYYPEYEGFIQIGDKSYCSLNDYQQDLGLDMNSITDDPEFIDVYNQNFTIEPHSPAVNAGKILGLQQDFYGTAVPSGSLPDIGLVELKNPSDSFITSFNNLDPIQYDFQVYPNPSRGVFNVIVRKNNSNDAIISIKDLYGKVVYKNIYSGDHDYFEEIDLSEIKKGIYIIAIEGKNKKLSQLLIIK